MSNEIELTVLIPCLNEAETLERCIRKAHKCMELNHIAGEVLVADNGSDDGSVEIAERCGARVAHISQRGYGSALIGGTLEARGSYCIMGDADDSYDFSNLMPYVEKLREGFDLVMGNRFKGGIEKGAMPFLHRYLGTPVISFLGRLFYHNRIGDFNCGMRGYNTERIKALKLQSPGMEYASEMIVQAALNHYSIAEVPTTLAVDGRSREPYLSTWSDGWRHLKFLLLHSPNWLFLIPGLILAAGGFAFMLLGILSSAAWGTKEILVGGALLLAGFNAVMFSGYTKIVASKTNYIPRTVSIGKWAAWTAEKGILTGVILFFFGLIALVVTLWIGNDSGIEAIIRWTVPELCIFIIGIEIAFGGFFVGVLSIGHK